MTTPCMTSMAGQICGETSIPGVFDIPCVLQRLTDTEAAPVCIAYTTQSCNINSKLLDSTRNTAVQLLMFRDPGSLHRPG